MEDSSLNYELDLAQTQPDEEEFDRLDSTYPDTGEESDEEDIDDFIGVGVDVRGSAELRSSSRGHRPEPVISVEEGLAQSSYEDADESECKRWDFRDGSFPEGLEVEGAAAEFETQADGSTALRVGGRTGLKLSLEGLTEGTRLNNFSVTMDVCFKRLPDEPLSLFQANADEEIPSDGEAFLYPGGGVGIFGETGVADAWVKQDKWVRVVVTCGTPASGGERGMMTYVNGKRCAFIRAEDRGVLGQDGGRFSLGPHSVRLFGSVTERFMRGGCVKYVEIRRHCMSAGKVKEQAYANRIWSAVEAEQKKENEKRYTTLSLHTLYKRPPPVWIHPTFLAAFGDAFIEKTGLEGGTLPVTMALFDLALQRILQSTENEQHATFYRDFSSKQMQALASTARIVGDSLLVAKRWELGAQSSNQLVSFMRRTFHKRLENMMDGDKLLVPGGVGGHDMLYVVERDEGKFRFVVINTSATAGLDYHAASGEQAPKIKYRTCVAVDDIPRDKMLDDAWWAFAFQLRLARGASFDMLYDILIPWLGGKPWEQIAAESNLDDAIDWRSPQRSQTAYYRCLLEAFHYLLRRRGLSESEVKVVCVGLRAEMMAMAEHDLHVVRKVSESDRRILKIAIGQLAYASVKLAERKDVLGAEQIRFVKDMLDRVTTQMEALPLDGYEGSVGPPPQLDLVNDEGVDQRDAAKHPLTDRLIREEDTDGLAGRPIHLPAYVPVDMLQIPHRVDDFEQALAAIRHCDRLCTLVSVQRHTIKNTAFFVVALIEHTFLHVVPVPKPRSSGDYAECVWAQPLRYALQLDILILLQRLTEHFAANVFALYPTRPFDAVKLVVSAAITCIADAVLRKVATDIPSEASLALIGSDGAGYALSKGHFDTQSETIEAHTPEINIARTAVLDYFAGLGAHQPIFNWELGNRPDSNTSQYLAAVCGPVAFPRHNLPGYVDGSEWLVLKNYPELECFRDISFYFKYYQNTDLDAFPGVGGWSQMDATLRWREGYEIFGFGAALTAKPTPPKTFTYRYPSTATPSHLTHPIPVNTEDDVLHIRNLPDFDNVMGQQDSELLISYLTVPYMRVPLVFSFFATEDRIHSLRSKQLQSVFDSVLFEPGKYLPIGMNREPQLVPAEDPQLLATPYGLLLNELYRSPAVVFESTLRLLNLALSLDTGDIHSSTSPVILYVVRLCARIDNYASFLVAHTNGEHESISTPLRDVEVSEAVLDQLELGLASLRKVLRGPAHAMLEAWSAVLQRQCSNTTNETTIEENTQLICALNAHTLLIYRNVRFGELNPELLQIILCAYVFMTTRHTWNMKLLDDVPETSLFEALQVLRRKLVLYTRMMRQVDLDRVMESIVRVTTGTGVRDDPDALLRKWGFVAGERSRGRFTVLHGRWRKQDVAERDGAIEELEAGATMNVEVDLQIVQLTLKSSHLSALSNQIADKPDVRTIFGRAKMQASTIQTAEHRDWLRLLGRGHELQHWKTPDSRPCMQELDREYVPGELESWEQWIVELFEPVRLSYLVKPFVLPIFIQEEPLSRDAHVAYMIGVHPQRGGTWKEIYVYRHLRLVHIYNVMSHGRRFYRSLEYTNDVRYTLREMQPSTDDRRGMWPSWERYGAGHPYAQYPDPTSVVILRDAEHPKNLSGGQETFIPSRLLYGIVPSALLDTHHFWQDEGDDLYGYPHEPEQKDKEDAEPPLHLIRVELKHYETLQGTREAGNAARITRVLRRRIDAELAAQRQLFDDIDAMKIFEPRPPPQAEDDDRQLDEDEIPKDYFECSFSVLKRLGELIKADPASGQTIMAAARQAQDNGTKFEEFKTFVELATIQISNVLPTSSSADAAPSSASPRTMDEEELELLNLLNSPPGSQLHSLARVLARIENLSYILAWRRCCNAEEGDDGLVSLDLVFLPRLKLSFFMKRDGAARPRLFSMDHVGLFISNHRTALTTELISGIPHSLLLSDATGETHVLVPSISVVRPVVLTAPFSTELVLDRSDQEWASTLENAYYLYPIHVSMSFMFTQTLASALYLLLLRFLHRDYDKVFRLATSVGTDTKFSKEEEQIFLSLGRRNADCHPDAHACRLKISLVTIDSPVVVPWRLTKQLSKYVTKLAHVSTTCHLEHADESQLFESPGVITSEHDPEFDRRIYTIYEIRLVKNRKLYLRALLNSHPIAPVQLVDHIRDSAWLHRRNLDGVLAPDEAEFLEMVVSYSPPVTLSGAVALDTLSALFDPRSRETMIGSSHSLGFLFLYELFTGGKKVKILKENNSHTFAELIYLLYGDRDDPSFLGSFANTLVHNPELRSRLPRYRDCRNYTGNTTIKGAPDDEEPVSPLLVLFNKCTPIVADYHAKGLCSTPPGGFMELPAPVKESRVRDEGPRDWMIPEISNFACEKRPLNTVAHGDGLTLSAETLKSFCGQPLEPVDLSRFCVTVPRAEAQASEAVKRALPFDVSQHPDGQSHVAKLMVQRLHDDMATYADDANSASVHQCSFVMRKHVEAMERGEGEEAISAAVRECEALVEALESLKAKDSAFVESALPEILLIANHVPCESESSTDGGSTSAASTGEISPAERLAQFCYLLKRHSGQETRVWLEYAFGALLSSRAEEDMLRLNPFFPVDRLQQMFDLVVGAILHANRVGHTNRCIHLATSLQGLLTRARTESSGDSKAAKELRANLALESENLARMLCTSRYFVNKEDNGALSYDPRFLVFEFTWNIVLRKQQVLLVNKLMGNMREGTSVVKQMIMGAGKTTVVGPLLTLMLGDGEHLVLQIVPPALLEFSRSVMRATFSSIMCKRVYTLHFDRSTQVNGGLHQKLQNAYRQRGVVMSTPTSVKSLMLRFLESLDIMRDSSRRRPAELQGDIREIGRILKMFRDGVLIMDEVDLILHPLKSELNFPVGPKHDLDFNPLRWRLPIHIMDGVFYADRGRMSVGFRQSTRALDILERMAVVIEKGYGAHALQRIPHLVLLNPDWYEDHLKPIMAEWTHLWLEAQHVSGLSKKEIIAFIQEGATSSTNPEIQAKMEEHVSASDKKMLNLAKDWLRSFLPHCLQKIDRVSFGLLSDMDFQKALKQNPHLPRTRVKLAIPFVGKDVPSESSEFAHPDVVIGLTVLAYRYEGLRWRDFDDIVDNLRTTLSKETGPWMLRKSSVTHAKWVREAGGTLKGEVTYEDLRDSQIAAIDEQKTVVPLRLLKRSNTDQMEALYDLIRLLPDTIHWYLENFIFPAYMRHQIIKLSACGQEVGGDMLFKRRIGFSGTPSDLLPRELGRCGYEAGSDGLMVHTLTSPLICSVCDIEDGWSVTSVLDRIATAVPHFNALIDTGALITGMSNLEVARYLLDHGLPWCDGVVFLDEYDRKMILVRATGRVLKLAQCGIPAKKRFAFYDQIHTTGMDIKHVLDARAVLTLGKDMTFRDVAQGAFRMRGIGKGQTIQFYAIPEVNRLITRQLKAASMPAHPDDRGPLERRLVDIIAWLVVNSMRSERIQYNMLCIQNTCNVWKKNAYSELLYGYDSFSSDMSKHQRLAKALDVFMEPIDFSLEAAVPDPKPFADVLDRRVEAHKHFVLSESEWGVIGEIKEIVSGSTLDASHTALEQEQVQEQEQEQEQEKEEEKEQEIEVEKYIDRIYARDNEEPTPWPFKNLANPADMESRFYKCSEFKLYHRRAIEFPPCVYVSNNYFDKSWSGDRRIKNVVMVMEWMPNMLDLPPYEPDGTALSEGEEVAFSKACHLLDLDCSGDFSQSELMQAIRSATDRADLDEATVGKLVAELSDGGGSVSFTALLKLLRSHRFREQQHNRTFVALSLAEAETIRRIMHMRIERPVIDGTNTAIALRCVPASNRVLDISHRFTSPRHYQVQTAYHALRFLNCNMHFTDAQLNVLIRGMQRSDPLERRIFFKAILGCRRRLSHKWDETPVSAVFRIPSEYHVLKQRAQAVRTREAIREKGLMLYDAFQMFDHDNNGLISASELWGALEWLGVPQLTSEDVLDFLKHADRDNDENLSYREFLNLLRDQTLASASMDEDGDYVDEEEAIPDMPTGSSIMYGSDELPIPKGEDELRKVLEQRKKQEQSRMTEEAAVVQAEEDEAELIKRHEEELLNMLQEGGPNPVITPESVHFCFTREAYPIRMKARGNMAFQNDEYGRKHLTCYRPSAVALEVPFGRNGGGRKLNRYTATMHVMLDELPREPQSLMRLSVGPVSSDAELLVDSSGLIGFGRSFASFDNVTMSAGRWHVVSAVVDTTEGRVVLYLDGMPVQMLLPEECFPDGPFSIDGRVELFGSVVQDYERGGNLKDAAVHSYPMEPLQIEAFHQEWRMTQMWECHVDTFRNEDTASECAICGTPRPIVADVGEPWACAICTFMNAGVRTQCEICQTPKST